ncbi:hypothetical protein C0Z19_00385 [Trinickia soli]|uniref:DUF746 domain-containing protein n=1 Tax=Trinickia soli TaxID=380675 RepID=A0A2N7WFL9_9BURK|nr:hypothetical protein C0Z19_00385 [Trinickia soli]
MCWMNRSSSCAGTNRKSQVTPTIRCFDPNAPLYTKGGRPLPDTEDRTFSAFVLRALRDARSKSEVPPACPHCGSRETILASRPHTRLPRPTFLCRDCWRRYNRLTGTPLARLRHETKLPAFVRLLSQQISYAKAADRLGVDYTAIANWTAKFRAWFRELDPTCEWERRVRLGLKPRALGACPNCTAQALRFYGFASESGDRRLSCVACGSVFSLSKLGGELQCAVSYDPAVASGRLDLPRMQRVD